MVLKVLIESCISLHSIFFSEIHLSWFDVIHFPKPLECKQCGIPACQNVYLVSVTTRKKGQKNFGLFLTYSQGQKQPFFVMLTNRNYTRNQGLVCLLSWKTSLTSSHSVAIGPLEGRVKAEAAVASIAA